VAVVLALLSPIVAVGWILSVDNEASHCSLQGDEGAEVRLFNLETQGVHDWLGCDVSLVHTAIRIVFNQLA
jgi:hypothetical protein